MRIKRRELYLYLGLFFMLFPIYMKSLMPSLLPSRFVPLLPLLSVILIYSYRNRGMKFRCNGKVALIAGLAYSIILFRAQTHSLSEYFQPTYLSMLLCMLLLHLDADWWEVFWRVNLWFCVFHLVTGLLLLPMPKVQLAVFVPMMHLTEYGLKILTGFIQQGYMTGLTYHYSTMGMYMAAGVVSAAKPLFANGGKSKPRDWFLFLAMILGLILTGKRGPFLFALLSLASAYWLINRPFTKKQYIRFFQILVASITVAILLYLTFPPFRSLLARFISDSGTVEDMSNGRVEFYWLNAILLFTEKPLWGWGWRSFRQINISRFGFDVANDAHNIYLQLLAETGIVGFAVFLILLVGGLVLTCKAIRAQRKQPCLTPKQMLSVRLALAYEIYFLLYGFTGNPLYDSQCYVPFFMCCTIGYAAWYQTKAATKRAKIMEVAT